MCVLFTFWVWHSIIIYFYLFVENFKLNNNNKQNTTFHIILSFKHIICFQSYAFHVYSYIFIITKTMTCVLFDFYILVNLIYYMILAIVCCVNKNKVWAIVDRQIWKHVSLFLEKNSKVKSEKNTHTHTQEHTKKYHANAIKYIATAFIHSIYYLNNPISLAVMIKGFARHCCVFLFYLSIWIGISYRSNSIQTIAYNLNQCL